MKIDGSSFFRHAALGYGNGMRAQLLVGAPSTQKSWGLGPVSRYEARNPLARRRSPLPG